MKKIALLMLCLFLTACETSYARQNLWLNNNLGYDDLALAPDVYLVNFKGNSQGDTPQDIFAKLFYRCAEISQENNARYFKVENFQTSSQLRQGVLPGWSSSSTSGSVYINPQTGLGSYSSQGQNFNIPPQTVSSRDITMQAVIKIVRNTATEKKDSLVDSEFILKNWDVKK